MALPSLSQFDVERAAQLIQQAYAPLSSQAPSDIQRRQQELFDIQKRPEAWGLVIPFLESEDPNIQFFGAHTAQVKIARDWDAFPQDQVESLRDLLLELTSRAVVAKRGKVVLRKLFMSLTALAIKLCSAHESRWSNWIFACVASLSGHGASTEHILDFLAIVAEEIDSADFTAGSKIQMRQTLMDAIPLVVQAVTTSVIQYPITGREDQSLHDLHAAFKCFEAWLSILPTDEITPFIPLFIALLAQSLSSSKSDPVSFDPILFLDASSALQEIMAKSALSDGSGNKVLTEPLLIWLDSWWNSGGITTLADDRVGESFCKLLVALGDHSTSYLAAHIASSMVMDAAPGKTRGQLVQTFLRVMLWYTGLPGYYGVDEEESEMTLGFWYLFQEALWSVDYYLDDGEEDNQRGKEREGEQWAVAKAVYEELVNILKRKVTFPPNAEFSSWSKDVKEAFQVYRRDVGDTLINAYYVLRDNMLGYYVSDITEKLSHRQQDTGWEDIEASLHCLMSVQEAVPLEPNVHLSRVFSAEILGALPTTGHVRIRRTVLGLIGTYASWFTAQTRASSASTPLLMNAIGYAVAALPEPLLCLQAANALRDLCDSNRAALAPHIAAFAEVHSRLTDIPDTERSKILQSIASVIQALPPEEEISPVEAIVSPVVAKLVEAIQSSSHLPDEARTVAIMQLQTISGVAKGLTRTTDSLLTFDDSPEEQAEVERMRRAREDPRIVKLRETIFGAIRSAMDLWSTDASVCGALSDLFKAITALPSDVTLLSLPAGPLLELVSLASQRRLNAIWLSLASMLVAQLNPPAIFPPTSKAGPDPEAQTVIARVLPLLLQTALSALGQPGAMVDNPDIVQDFFGCMDTVAQNFVSAFYNLPSGALDALMQCSISALALQERYSLIMACTFLATLINRTFVHEELLDSRRILVQVHCRPILRAVLCGFAGVAPRSSTPNLVELLTTLVSRCTADCKIWFRDILFADDFVPSKASPEDKERFVKAASSSRSLKRVRDAAQQFTLIARGLDGSSFGYATVVM